VESPEFYKSSPQHITSVMTRLDDLARELERVLERWMELEERS
jgi:hypothetical protein